MIRGTNADRVGWIRTGNRSYVTDDQFAGNTRR